MNQFISGVVRRLQERGIFHPDLDPAATAKVLHGVLDHVVEETLELDDDAALAAVAPVFEVLCLGLAPRE